MTLVDDVDKGMMEKDVYGITIFFSLIFFFLISYFKEMMGHPHCGLSPVIV